MMRRIAFLPLLFLVASVAGCVDYEEHITLRHDGSGTMRVAYSCPRDVKLNSDGLDLPEGDEEKLREQLEKRYTSDHVRVVNYEVREKGDQRVVDFSLEFDDIEALGDLDTFAWDSRIRFEQNGDEITVKRVLHVDSDGDWDDESDSALEEWVKKEVGDKILSKIRFRFELAFPEKVEESNAHWVRGERVAVWRYSLADVVGRRRILQYASGR